MQNTKDKEGIIRLPRVTEVLAPYQNFSGIKAEVLEAATIRGTRVHEACAAVAKGLWLPELDEEISGYVASFEQLMDMLVGEVVAVEERFTDEAFGFRGTPDLVFRAKVTGILVVLDNKTPLNLSPIWEAQLGAYWQLVGNRFGERVGTAGTARLDPSGGLPKVDWLADPAQAFLKFVYALHAYKHLILPQRKENGNG